MSILIDRKRCTGCGRCAEACPGNLIFRDEDGRAYLKHPEDCWGCASCLKECRFQAVRYFLGADIGGCGAAMYVREEEPFQHWIIERPDGSSFTVTVDRRDANKY